MLFFLFGPSFILLLVPYTPLTEFPFSFLVPQTILTHGALPDLLLSLQDKFHIDPLEKYTNFLHKYGIIWHIIP